MACEIYVWTAAYYVLSFAAAAGWLTDQCVYIYDMVWRLCYWTAFFVYFRHRKYKAEAIGMTVPDRKMPCTEAIFLFLLPPAQALLGICLRPGTGAEAVQALEAIHRICTDISAALIEEILFRGVILFGVLRAFRIKAAYAVMISAAIFAAAHFINLFGGGYAMPYVMLQAGFAFGAGIGLSALSVYEKSIVPAIILHTLINLSEAAAEPFAGLSSEPWITEAAVFAAAYLIAGALIMRRQGKEEKHYEVIH